MKYPNYGYGQTPLFVDVDKDGIKDLIWINMKGPLKVYSNKNVFNNNYLNVKLPA